MIANRRRERIARLRQAIAANQPVSGCRVACQRGCDRAAFQDLQTKRGIADAARHYNAVAGLRAAAMDHLARRHTAERGDRDHQGTRRGHCIAAEQRTAEV